MKKWCIGCALLTTILLFGSCKSSKNCKGGGWYGNRNLGYVPEKSKDHDTVYDKKLATDCESVEP